ncbi:YhgE/Pip domain-containing protein [Cohnella panacarvi]|uniref:YhgE/Pip domain-containing protein n=1 Tax=Cohnella panacarvi TaxID=400776 RepID=UPI00047AEC00|nr:YhgE/Pip domain-containing protein [Cohnella panacarvi]
MKGLKQFAQEVAAIVRHPRTLIPVAGVLMIPVMYSGMFLGAFWDPYGNMDKLPVAVVNADAGTVTDGKTIRIGQDFADELKQNASFDWQFVGREQAEKGLSDHSYYMAIEIPADFSAKTATLTTEQPSPAEIVFLKDEGSNFLASQIGNNVVERMRTELSQEVTRAYARTVLDEMSALADGLGDASNGAGELAAGAADAKDGAAMLRENLHKLATGSETMQQGIDKLASGASALTTGAADAREGSAALADGLAQLNEAKAQLASGAGDVDQSAQALADGLDVSAAGAAKLQSSAAALSAGLSQLAEAKPELADDASFKQLLAASKQLATGAADAQAGQEKLAAGADTLKDGVHQLAGGLTAFGDKLGEATDGGKHLASGAEQLHTGAAQLNKGMSELSDKFQGIADGSSKLDQGASDIASGLIKLADGTDRLSSKLSDAAKQTSGISGDGTDGVIDMFASPVGLDVVKTTEVANYGTGFAPYFLSLGLFVGGLLLTVVYSVKEPAVAPRNAWSWFAGKTMTLVLIGTLQALIADAVLFYGIGLEVRSLPSFVLFSILTSVTFMSIIQLLVATMGNPGRFLAIILLIFQLTSSGGTFPLEMIPSWLQSVSSWLPMTYAIDGFRAIISSGDFSAMRSNAGVMAVYIAAFAALTYAFFFLSHRKQQRQASAKASHA